MTPWTEIAGQLDRRQGDLPLDEQVLEFLNQLPSRQPILVACSGGADSVFLVLALLAGLPDSEKRLHVGHFNHGLRGEASEGDAAFVKEMAKHLGLPVTVGFPAKAISSDEASLRAARYGWMTRHYADLGAGGLCLGHHADDVLESQIMALFTGSGPSGLAAPLPVNRFPDGHVRLRPLLAWQRRQIETFLREFRVDWREDASNADPSYTRNWVRQELIPLAIEHFPQNIYAGSVRTRMLMEETLDCLDAAVLSLELDFSGKTTFPVDGLVAQPLALIRRAFMGWWLRHRAEVRLDKAVVDKILGLIYNGNSRESVSIGQGQCLFIDDNGGLRLKSDLPPQSLVWRHDINWSWPTGPLFLPDGGSLTASRVELDSGSSPPYLSADPACEAWLSISGDSLVVRQWQDGDRYRPLGAPGTRKLQDMFTDSKLSLEQKRRLPVILEGDSILWVPGFPPNESVRVLPSDNSALKLTYTP